jgi:hypothetical protein
MSYGLKCGDLALAAGDVVDDESSSGLAGILVVEEIPDLCQYKV